MTRSNRRSSSWTTQFLSRLGIHHAGPVSHETWGSAEVFGSSADPSSGDDGAAASSEESFRNAFLSAPIGIAIITPASRFINVNRAFCELLGYEESELKNLAFHEIMFREDVGPALMEMCLLRASASARLRIEQRFRHRCGSPVWTIWNASLADGSDPEVSNLILQIQDISDRKQNEERLRQEATHDLLTGLPNRAFFTERLLAALERSKCDPKYRVSVLFIDIDRFKNVNDSLGHTVGDKLLTAVAKRLQESMRPPDLIARLGGDEFIVLVEGRYYMESLDRIARRIGRAFDEPFNVNGRTLYSSGSIGILQVTDEYSSVEDVIRDADTAMYHAKNLGKARHVVFDRQMRVDVRESLQLENDLRQALSDDTLEAVFQPIIDLRSGAVAGFEALARWAHPKRGPISPEKFIPMAEEISCIQTLGTQILRKSCAAMASLFAEDGLGDSTKLSVNLSYKQLGQPDFIERIREIIHETNFSASRLKFELTESVLFEHQRDALGVLNELRELGIEFDIDDFGTGYSNLGQLVRLPLSSLKIDRSFVRPINKSGADLEIVRTIISMARNLGLGVVAEGLETECQLETLRSLGCDRGQGFLFGRPMDIDAVRELLLRREPCQAGPWSTIDVHYAPALQ